MPTYSLPASLPEGVARLAQESGLTLQRLIAEEQQVGADAVRLRVERPDGSRADLAVPPAALALLASLLEEMGRGGRVAVLSTRAELTTQQAADVLRVSRPYLVKLLTDGRIPHRSVGTRRRVLLEDVLRYQEHNAAARHRVLDELAAESQALGMY